MVYEKQWMLLLSTLLLQLTEGEDHVQSEPPGYEATLWLRLDSWRKAMKAVKGDPGKDFANYV